MKLNKVVFLFILTCFLAGCLRNSETVSINDRGAVLLQKGVHTQLCGTENMFAVFEEADIRRERASVKFYSSNVDEKEIAAIWVTHQKQEFRSGEIRHVSLLRVDSEKALLLLFP